MIKALKALYFVFIIGAVGLLAVNTFGIITDRIDGKTSTIMTMVIIALAYGMITVKRSIRSREKEQAMLLKRERDRERDRESEAETLEE
ncbi:MAG: hypothetical protein IJ070_00285 [Firmicutes bacterium]|nr:hypothetical protein [Bacillota bacterium]